MQLEHTTKVTWDNGPRPAGPDDQCFYCDERIGSQHKPDCVLRKKVVMVEITMTIPRVVPESWDSKDVEFHINESSWCADNIVDDLQRLIDSRDGEAPCLCLTLTGKVVREATEEDIDGIDLMKLAND